MELILGVVTEVGFQELLMLMAGKIEVHDLQENKTETSNIETKKTKKTKQISLARYQTSPATAPKFGARR